MINPPSGPTLLGVDVILFRGNNRNRRRGFHNLWVVARRLEALRSRI